MSWTTVDELDAIELPEGFVWRPIRRRFGIRAFGINAYTPTQAGSQVIEEHTEQALGHQEIYIVLRGRARFTIDGADHELGPGQMVFLRDPELRRGAVALEPDTVVIALGGRPGKPHVISPWEAMFAAAPAVERGDWDEAIRIHQEALAELPDNAPLLYNLACIESRAGRTLDALLHLERSIELDPNWAEHARTDPDFDPIRSEPAFPA